MFQSQQNEAQAEKRNALKIGSMVDLDQMPLSVRQSWPFD